MEEGLDDDIELVGTKADASLNAMPHARCHCPKHNFKQVKADAEVQAGTREQNCKTCDKCYCYVCDTLASECASWQDHCMAYDRDPVWRQRRQEKKEGGPKVELEVVGLDEFGNVIEREVGAPDPRLVDSNSGGDDTPDA